MGRRKNFAQKHKKKSHKLANNKNKFKSKERPKANLKDNLLEICDNLEDFALSSSSTSTNKKDADKAEEELSGAFLESLKSKVDRDQDKVESKKKRIERRLKRRRQLTKKTERNLCSLLDNLKTSEVVKDPKNVPIGVVNDDDDDNEEEEDEEKRLMASEWKNRFQTSIKRSKKGKRRKKDKDQDEEMDEQQIWKSKFKRKDRRKDKRRKKEEMRLKLKKKDALNMINNIRVNPIREAKLKV